MRWYETDDLDQPLPRPDLDAKPPAPVVPPTDAELLWMRVGELETLVKNALVNVQGSKYRGSVPSEFDLSRILNPQIGDVVTTQDNFDIFLYTHKGWHLAAGGAGTIINLPPGQTPITNVVKTVPLETTLLASTGQPDEVQLASDTGRLWKWVAGQGWQQTTADPAILQGLVAALMLRNPVTVAGDKGAVLTATGVPGEAAWLPLEPHPLRLVDTDADRAALGAKNPERGTLCIVKATGWTWRWDGTTWKVFSDYITVGTHAEMDALIPGCHIGTLCGVGTNVPGSVGDHAIYQLLPDPRTPGALAWMAMLPQVDPAHGEDLQTLSYNPALGFGERVRWEDDRTRLEVVTNIADLSNRAFLPESHLVVGKLVFVRGLNRLYQFNVDVAAGNPITNTIADWLDINAALDPPGLEGIIVAPAAPQDPGTAKWTDLTTAAVAATKPGSYWVITDPATVVPQGVPDIAGLTVGPGDWVVAVDGNGDGTSDSLHLVHIPVQRSDRPAVHMSSTHADTPNKASTATVTITDSGHTTHRLDNNQRFPNAAAPGDREIATTSGTVAAGEPFAGTAFAAGDEFIFTDSPALAGGPGTTEAPQSYPFHQGWVKVPSGTASPITVSVISPVMLGLRDDVFYNSTDNRMWIHDGTTWRGIVLGKPELPGWTKNDAGKVLGIEYDTQELAWRAGTDPIQLYVTVPATGAPPNAMTWDYYAGRSWSDFKVGVPAIIREVDANGIIPSSATGSHGLSTLNGKRATPGDWVVPIDTNNNGAADAVALIRQQAHAPFHHKMPPPAETPTVWIDRGLAAFGLTTANDAPVLNESKIGGMWDVYITGQARSACDLSLIIHTGSMISANTDEPLQTIDTKTAVGPWTVKAQAPYAIRIRGTAEGWDIWEVQFTGTDQSGRRIFDRMTLQSNHSAWDLPCFGVHASTGNVYAKARLTLFGESVFG